MKFKILQLNVFLDEMKIVKIARTCAIARYYLISVEYREREKYVSDNKVTTGKCYWEVALGRNCSDNYASRNLQILYFFLRDE